MSRTIITAVVAAVIVALTAIAFFVSNISVEKQAQKDADAALERAYQVVQRLNQLQSIDVQNKAERLAAYVEFSRALKESNANPARVAFQKFTKELEDKKIPKPDLMALVDASGQVVAMHDVAAPGNMWLNPNKAEKNPTLQPTVLPGLNVALGKRIIISDVWNDGNGFKRVAVAPVIDPEVVNPKDPEGVVIIGAVVVAYAQTAKSAQLDRTLVGTEIAYYDNKKVVAASFDAGEQVSALLAGGQITESGSKQRVEIDGVEYLAAAVKMPLSATKTLPPEYPASNAGVAVLAPLSKDDGVATSSTIFILVLGGGSLAIAMLGIYLVHRRLIAQVDQVEQGVTDIINGNVDRTFRPVGPELDGLANGLNVMLARLLGRPEPGEEEFDEDGNPIIPGRVEFEEGEQGGGPDPELAALAQESEPDYYKRVYTEYLAARKATGAPDEVSFENFIAKLKVNEGKLRAQYQCRTVRFRVVTKDGKVSLKPVPIFS